ncbi:MAG: PAS domain S-box protein, partial [Gemmatimonadota bacterium]
MAVPSGQFKLGPVVLPETRRPRPVVAYTGAVALVAAATAVRAGLSPWVTADQIVFVTFFPVLFVAAWILGPKPTLLATALSALCADFFFIAPRGTFGSKDPAGYLGIAVLILCGIAIAILAEREHRARVLAEAQAEENAQLRDLAEEAASQAEEEAARAEEEAARAEEEAARAEDEAQRGLLLLNERDRLIAELELERTSLQAIVKYLPVGLVMRSADSGEVTFVNGQVEQLLGVLPGPDTWRDAITSLAFRRFDGSPIGVNELPLSRVLRDGLPISEDVECTRADGQPLALHFEAGPVKDADGNVTGGVLTMLDVTARRRTEETVRFLAEASTALGVSLDYEATLATVARLAVPALADWCSIDLAEPDGTLRRIAITNTDATREPWAWELERRFPATRAAGGGAYQVLDSGESSFVPVITPEMIAASAHDPEYIRIIGELGLVSYIGVPLAAHGQVFGVLSFVTSDSSRHYTTADLRLAEALGQRAGAAVDIARRHRETVESANMLAAMLTASPVGQAFVDRDLRYVAVNPALAALHGVPVDEHFGRAIRDVLPVWADPLEPMHRAVFETGQPVLDRELTLPAPGGGEYHLLVNCFPVLGADGEVRWVGVTKADVTERRRSEQALRTSEARLRGVVESPLIGIGFYDRDGRVTSANGALADLLGYTREEIANGVLRWDSNLTAPEFRYLDEQAGREVEETGASRAYEKELIRKDGTRVPVLAGGSRLSEDGRTGVFYILDLTERRRVTEQVQAAQRLEAVGRLAGGVAHEINNALQGVLGFNSFILKRLEEGHPVRSDAEQVHASGERAARITQQLLAYSRRQVLQQKDL